jgi:hypothetical protein
MATPSVAYGSRFCGGYQLTQLAAGLTIPWLFVAHKDLSGAYICLVSRHDAGRFYLWFERVGLIVYGLDHPRGQIWAALDNVREF